MGKNSTHQPRKNLDRRKQHRPYPSPNRRQQSRRREDRLNNIIYYTMLGSMTLILLLWIVIAELYKGSTHAA